MSKWKEFEKIIADIQKQTDPDAIVRHNHHVKGKSGRRRQLDITISKKVGIYSILIVIECKNYKRPVGIERVEAFVTKLRDVGASQGVIASNSGFDEGAKAIARENSITLVSYRKAEDIDWHSLVGSRAKVKAIVTGIERRSLSIIDENNLLVTASPETIFCNDKGNIICTAKEFYKKVEDDIGLSLPVGPFALEITPKDALFMKVNDEVQRVRAVLIRGVNKAWEHSLDLSLASGHILENPLTQEAIYNQAITQSIEWQEILAQPSREISQEEYEDTREHKEFLSTPMRTDNMKGSFRVVITKK